MYVRMYVCKNAEDPNFVKYLSTWKEDKVFWEEEKISGKYLSAYQLSTTQ